MASKKGEGGGGGGGNPDKESMISMTPEQFAAAVQAGGNIATKKDAEKPAAAPGNASGQTTQEAQPKVTQGTPPPENPPQPPATPVNKAETPKVELKPELGYKDVNELIIAIQNGDYEFSKRNARYEALHGRKLFGRFRAWLAGDGKWMKATTTDENGQAQHRLVLQGGDIQYDPATGQLRHNLGNEILRKVANLGIRTASTAGITLATAWLTGGLSTFALPAIIGAAGGRATVEAARAFFSGERNMKMDLEAARIAYFQKARVLAAEIPPEHDPTQHGPDEAEHVRARNSQIKNLVNFLYSYENLAVDIVHDRQGNPIVAGDPINTPDVPNPANPIAEPTNQPPSTVTTMDYTPSAVAPDAVTMKSIEDRLQKSKKTWDFLSSLGGAVGGAVGAAHDMVFNGARGLAHLQKTVYDGLVNQLQRGEVVRGVDINGDHTKHAIQFIGEKLAFHYNNLDEYFKALAEGAHAISSNQAEFAAHAIDNASTLQVHIALLQAAKERLVTQLAGIGGALVSHAIVEKFIHNLHEGNFTKFREKEAHNTDKERERFTPEQMETWFRARAEQNHMHFPVLRDRYALLGTDLHLEIIAIDYEHGFATCRESQAGEYNPTRPVQILDLITPEKGYVYLVKSGLAQAPAPTENAVPGAMPENPAPNSAPAVGGEAVKPKPENLIETEESKIIPIEKDQRKIGLFETAGERRTKAGEPHETFIFNEVGEPRNGDQLMMSIKDTANPPLAEEQLKELAVPIELVYREGISRSLFDPENLSSIENYFTKFHTGLEDKIPATISWSAVFTTKEGRYFGYRFRDNDAQLFHFSDKLRVPSSKRKSDGGSENRNFYYGYLRGNETLALLDGVLSKFGDEEIDGKTRQQIRAEILGDSSLSPSQMTERLAEIASAGDANEVLALITRRTETETTAETNSIMTVKAKRQEAGTLMEIEFNIIPGEIYAMKIDNKDCFFEVSIDPTNKDQVVMKNLKISGGNVEEAGTIVESIGNFKILLEKSELIFSAPDKAQLQEAIKERTKV
jgi:hypothetical protein